LTPTSARRRAAPVPSIISPPLMTRSSMGNAFPLRESPSAECSRPRFRRRTETSEG
jgi:hypothetical protein